VSPLTPSGFGLGSAGYYLISLLAAQIEGINVELLTKGLIQGAG
jgi:hypothetical protein